MVAASTAQMTAMTAATVITAWRSRRGRSGGVSTGTRARLVVVGTSEAGPSAAELSEAGSSVTAAIGAAPMLSAGAGVSAADGTVVGGCGAGVATRSRGSTS